jgi:ribosomal protein S18 acetylase RimI-like enzyme
LIEIIHASSDDHIKQAKLLFIEYASSLDFDLCFQNFDKEIDEMPGKYSPPDGRLLLALSDDEYAGCIALRKIEEGICEMKRLFVRPEFRSQQIGKLLTDKIIDEARTIGYTKMRLDTIENKMKEAVNLYKSYGFYEIDAYYDNPETGVLYMELIL